MATGVGWVHFEGYHYTDRPLKPPLWYKNMVLISYTSCTIVNFIVLYSQLFRYYGNRSRSGGQFE